MESLHRVSVAWFGLGFATLAWLGGCAQSGSTAARPGEFEMRVESGAAYAVVGRFHLMGVEPDAQNHELNFDAATSSVRVPLAPGAYVLTLHAGARLVCRDQDGAPRLETTASERLVSAWPQRISIAPGELTTARIGFGFASAAAPGGLAPLGEVTLSPDPCAGAALDAGAEQALLAH